jgi:hypothetical protein
MLCFVALNPTYFATINTFVLKLHLLNVVGLRAAKPNTVKANDVGLRNTQSTTAFLDDYDTFIPGITVGWLT